MADTFTTAPQYTVATEKAPAALGNATTATEKAPVLEKASAATEKTPAAPQAPTAAQQAATEKDTTATENTPVAISLEQALEIALSQSPSVKVADKEIERTQYARKGSYAALFPQINASGSYQRTIKKQVMYMGGDDDSDGEGGGGGMAGMMSEIMAPFAYYIQQLSQGTGITLIPYVPQTTTESSSDGGIQVGRWNTYNAGISASMPLINAQLWKSISISADDVELAVEKARSSRLEVVNQVKQAYYGVLLAKEAFEVYKRVYENAVANYELTEKRYKASKASELDYARAKTTVANAIPNVYNAESSIILSLWQLKAVMGVNLDTGIDVAGTLSDYSSQLGTISDPGENALDYNSTLRQLTIQANQLAKAVQAQKYAYLPSLALSFAYSLNAMTNDFKFSEYKWTPYSYVGLSLNIPIFSGGQRLNNVRQSKVQAEELAIQRENTERQLHIAIRQSLSTMDTAVKSYESALDALESAQKAYDIAQKSYEIGRSTLTDLDSAQLALTQAQLLTSQAIYNYLVAKAGLESTIGADYTAEK